jgi:hypothetical protein
VEEKEMNIMEVINSNSAYIISGITILLIILMALVIVLLCKLSKLNKKYKQFMQGSDGKNLEAQILSRFSDIEKLKEDSTNMSGELIKIKENLLITFQKVGVVKYDAFKEMGGKLSFVMALLDKNNSGILLNSVHSSREGCYTYLKEIIKGESFLELSEDEKKALSIAIKSGSFME